MKVGNELICIKSLFKSTYKKNAFTKNKKYKIHSIDEFVWLIDNETKEFNFSKDKQIPYYNIQEYFKI